MGINQCMHTKYQNNTESIATMGCVVQNNWKLIYMEVSSTREFCAQALKNFIILGTIVAPNKFSYCAIFAIIQNIISRSLEKNPAFSC